MRIFAILIASGGLAAVLLMAACSGPIAENKPVVNKLAPHQLNAMLQEDKDMFFLDVRSPEEIRELGTLPGYVNIPIDQLKQRFGELPRDKTIITA